jgi:Carboxypeptidase regulatory-like domain
VFRRILGLFILIAVAGAQQAPVSPIVGSGYRISGTVVSGNGGGPLSGTKVQIAPTTNLQAVRQYVTGEDGQFVFEKLPPAKYALTAARHGFREQAFNEHGNYSTAIAVGPNLNSENLVFRLNADAEIFGKVTEDGDPVPNGTAMLFHHAAEEGLALTHFAQSVPIDDQGNYHFSHILAGTYFVAVQAEPWYAQHQFTPAPPQNGDSSTVTTVRRSGRGIETSSVSAARLPEPDPKLDVVYPSTFYENATDFSAATSIVVHPGEKYQADISLHAVRALRLRVHMNGSDPKQQPALYVTQPLLGAPAQGGHVMMQRIGDDLEMIGLPPGHLLLNIQNQGASRQEELDLSGDTEINLNDKPLADSLTGTLTFPGAESTPQNVWLMLSDRRSRTNLNTQVATDGSFSIHESVPIGSYQVYVNNALGYVPERISAAGARVVGQTVEINSNPTQPVRLSIVMSRQLGRVDGTAYLQDKPVAGAMIVLVPKDPTHNPSLFRRDQSDSDGTFSLPAIVPGKYTLIALQDGWDLEWSNPAVFSPYVAAGQEVEIAANGKYTAKVNVQSLH